MGPTSSPQTPVQPQDRHLAPTLIIGLGGSGKDVALRVRRLFYERHGHTGYPIIGYFVLDTDKNAFTRLEGDSPSDFVLRNIQLDDRGAVPEAIDCSLSEREFSDYFRGGQAQYPHIFRWLDPAMARFPANTIVAGAGQQRPFGRLAFFHHYDRIVNTLAARLREILRQAAEASHWRSEGMAIDAQRLEVILVYSLAGGTGAGMFMDMGMLARQLIQRGLGPASAYPQPFHVQPFFTHIAILPETFVETAREGRLPLTEAQQITTQENAFAALREMEFFSMRPSQTFDLSIPSAAPRLGEDPAAAQPWYLAWWNKNTDPLEIDSSPWDCCYLVSGGNDLINVGCLPPHEVYQMIAEYIFLDFDPNRFGLRKRSLRPNSIGPSLIPMADPVADETGKVLYNHFVSRRFSAFGLSQIYFDRDRMRRAASHRLAWLLVHQWWLREAAISPQALAEKVQQDWAGHPAAKVDDRTMPLTYEGLRDFVLRVNVNDNTLRTRWDEVRDDAAALKREIEDGKYDRSSEDPIARLERKHELLLLSDADGSGTSGLALRTFEHHRKVALPEIEARLRSLFREAIQKLGLRGALKLLQSYGTLHAEQDNLARSVQGQTPARSRDREERLAEARRLPIPFCVALAARIELLRGLKQSVRYLIGLYHQAVVPDVRRCLDLVGRRLSTSDNDTGASFHHLLSRFQSVLEAKTGQLTGVTHVLAGRFNALRQQDGGQTRTIGLLPQLEEADYDRMIMEQIRPAQGGANGDWPAIEQQVLAELRAGKGEDWADVKTLADLVVRVAGHDPDRMPDQFLVDKLAKGLAEACESLLQGFAGRLSALELFNREPAKQAQRLDTLRTRSAPFMRKSGAVNLPPGADTTLIQYLGVANSTSPAATVFANQLQQTGTALQAMTGLERFDMENDALVLYQEKSGIPLCYYSLLDHLGNLYSRSNRLRETHFDFPALKGRMPDIRKVDLHKQRNLANCLESTLYGIMTSVLTYDRSHFRLWTGALAFPLGSQFEDVFNHAAENPTVRGELQNQVEAWMKKALASGQGGRLALLWCAVQYLHEEVRQRLQWRIDRDGSAGNLGIQEHPLLSILAGRMVPRLRKRLEHLPDGTGSRWLASGLDILSVIANPNLEAGERTQAVQHWRQLMRDYMEPISDEVPIPVIRPGAQLDLEALGRTGGAARPVMPRQPDNGAPAAPQGTGREKE